MPRRSTALTEHVATHSPESRHSVNPRRSHKSQGAITVLLGWLVLAVSHPVLAEPSLPLSFSEDVRPILSNNCFQCHGPDAEQREADLRLDTVDGIQAALDADDLLQSELLLRLQTDDPDLRMPPPATKKVVDKNQVRQIETWLRQGAPWQKHWAFQPIQRATPPSSAELPAQHPIDRFINRKLAQNSIEPSPRADAETLVRRLYLDLLGVLPSPDASNEFCDDTRSDAYERLVDRLLSDPRFGERWGRHWLDQARYADSDGYTIDGARVMWPYRDWVIDAINDDLPFDQFTIEQLAGDLLPDPTVSQQIATGFHRNTLINQEGGTDPEQFRNEAVVDRVNTTGTVWLGLTVGCAQCHTHKYDPIQHHEYYQLFAFFNSDVDRNTHAPQVVAAPEELQSELQRLRTQKRQADQAYKPLADEPDESADKIKAKQFVDRASKQLREFETRWGKSMVLQLRDEPRETFVHVRGDFLRHGSAVQPETLDALPARSDHQSPDRLGLAKWLVDERNPLTARVTVNRAWMRYFGRGIVETEDDFGTQGSAPSHPELLDWLASELLRRDWSMKSLHRLIVTSETYQRSSQQRPDLNEIDANNLWLARQTRLRVTAEIVRDLALSAGGLLTAEIGGPSVYPPQPEGVYAFTQTDKNWKNSEGRKRYRRGMYTFFYRSAAHPFLTTFDTPNFQSSCTKRLRSNTPLQSLTQANDISVVEAARGLAHRTLVSDSDGSKQLDDQQRLDRAFEICLSRRPSPYESERLLAFIESQRRGFENDAPSATELTGSHFGDIKQPVSEIATWVAVARVLLNLDEFITRS